MLPQIPMETTSHRQKPDRRRIRARRRMATGYGSMRRGFKSMGSRSRSRLAVFREERWDSFREHGESQCHTRTQNRPIVHDPRQTRNAYRQSRRRILVRCRNQRPHHPRGLQTLAGATGEQEATSDSKGRAALALLDGTPLLRGRPRTVSASSSHNTCQPSPLHKCHRTSARHHLTPHPQRCRGHRQTAWRTWAGQSKAGCAKWPAEPSPA